MRKLILAGAAAAAVIVPMLATTADAYAADVVRSCQGNHRLGNTGVWYGDLSVRNMTCRRGRRFVHGARLSNGGVVVAGWSCRLIGYYGDGGIFRCTRDRRAMRFSAGG